MVTEEDDLDHIGPATRAGKHTTGFLSQPHPPDIPGIASFDGKVVHTAAWDDSYRFAGRRVAIIGTGATAVQLVPELAKEAADLTVYQRTAIHVVPKIDFAIPTVMQRLFARLPLVQRVFRSVTDTIFELITVSVVYYRQFRRLGVAGAYVATINRFVSIRDRNCVANRHRTTTSVASGPPGPTTITAPSPNRMCTWDKPDRADRAGRCRRRRRAQGPSSTPSCWPTVSTCGTPTSRHRGDRPSRPQLGKVVARE